MSRSARAMPPSSPRPVPAGPRGAPRSGKPGETTADGAFHVLVVEDDPVLAALLVRAFGRVGASAVVAGNATEAVASARARSFDAVVCDVILPGIEGTTLYHRLLDDFPDLAHRFVFVTGWARDGRVHRLLEHTGRPVLHQPFETAELVALTRSLAAGTNPRVSARN